MTRTRGPYQGRTVVFATMHGKENLAREPFATELGATVVATEGCDTDQFGTFDGGVPRVLTPLASARAKARLGMQISGSAYGLASEGSFESQYGLVANNTELLLFVDESRRLELVETTAELSVVPGGRAVTSVHAAVTFADATGFPAQGLIVQVQGDGRPKLHKEIRSEAELRQVVEQGLSTGNAVTVMPDYRSHRSPFRAERIRSLCVRMAARLATACPACDLPGFGRIGTEPGAVCEWCGSTTPHPVADVLGCSVCDHQVRVARTGPGPSSCDNCDS